jgi:hypothetical protein
VTWLTDALGPLDGGRIAGGCEDCDAHQTVAPIVAGVWRVTVHHDPDCPTLRAVVDGAPAPTCLPARSPRTATGPR